MEHDWTGSGKPDDPTQQRSHQREIHEVTKDAKNFGGRGGVRSREMNPCSPPNSPTPSLVHRLLSLEKIDRSTAQQNQLTAGLAMVRGVHRSTTFVLPDYRENRHMSFLTGGHYAAPQDSIQEMRHITRKKVE
jgi:hypothetical protein